MGHYCPQCLPHNRGFDSFYGYLTGAEDYYKKTFCIPLVPNQRPAACGYDFYSNTDRDPSANGTYSTFQFRDAANKGERENSILIPRYFAALGTVFRFLSKLDYRKNSIEQSIFTLRMKLT